MVVGLLGYFDGPLPYIPRLTFFYQDIRSDLVGIDLAVLIIDNANQMLATRQEKKRLILQMGSPDNAFAIEAVRMLRSKRWLTDGSLRRAYLPGANLPGANLEGAKLRGCRNWTSEQLNAAATLEGAKLPEGYTPPVEENNT